MSAQETNLEEEKVVKNVTEFRRHPDGVEEVYTNFIALSWTLFDVRMRLGQVIPTASKVTETGFVAEEKYGLTMAWPQAKDLLARLTDAITRYEQANGEIKPLKLPKNS